MMQYGAKMHAIIATINIGQTGMNAAHLAVMFTVATLMHLLTLNLLIYENKRLHELSTCLD